MSGRKKRAHKSFTPINPDSFRETRLRSRLRICEVAQLLHVSRKTVENWERGITRIPYSAFKLLRISTGYELPGIGWKGWSIRGDTLWSPDDRSFNSGDLGYLSLTFAMARIWRQEYERRRAYRVGLREQCTALAVLAPHVACIRPAFSDEKEEISL